MGTLLLPPARLVRWVANFETRHGTAELGVVDDALRGEAADGSWFTVGLPFGRPVGATDLATLAAAAAPPEDWGVLLVRKGGYAVARLHGDALVAHKVGQRHVQGRTKAGGQSQQRFARRRENQARAAYQAAAGHARELLAGVPWLVTGGDRTALAETLSTAGIEATVDPRLVEVAEPRRRSVLDAAIADAGALHLVVRNA